MLADLLLNVLFYLDGEKWCDLPPAIVMTGYEYFSVRPTDKSTSMVSSVVAVQLECRFG
jgi:hypothetical protein